MNASLAGVLIMATDHIVLIVIGIIGVIGGIYLLAEAKAYRARHQSDNKHQDTKN